MRTFTLATCLLILPNLQSLPAQTREEKVRSDKAKVEAEGFWIYNDLPQAYREARQSGKPILVVLRCLPCEECVKLDDELVESDPTIRPLLEKFVRVRIVGTNGLDLNTFQYDTDQSFAVFMLNADKTIYGRFGTRSHRTDWIGDVSLPGMARALEGALALHAQYPANKSQLAGKTGRPLEFDAPEKYPALRDKFTDKLNYSGDVVKSCIHCHQIGDARREFYWSTGKPIPDKLLYPYPHPKSVGLILDPLYKARVQRVVSASPASQAGLQSGDDIQEMNGQPLLSMADVQWVLHHIPASGGSVDLLIERGGETLHSQLELADGWRMADDTSWRVAAWGMRRIATGGMRLIALNDEEREAANIKNAMALRVASLGKYGAHAAARKAGFQEEDILVAIEERSDLASESELFAYVNAHHRPGDRVSVRILRDGQDLTLELPIQE